MFSKVRCFDTERGQFMTRKRVVLMSQAFLVSLTCDTRIKSEAFVINVTIATTVNAFVFLLNL